MKKMLIIELTANKNKSYILKNDFKILTELQPVYVFVMIL